MNVGGDRVDGHCAAKSGTLGLQGNSQVEPPEPEETSLDAHNQEETFRSMRRSVTRQPLS